MKQRGDKKQRNGKFQPVGCWIRREKRLAVYLRDRITCVYCGHDLRNAAPADVTLDHLVARSAGGTNAATNLVTACRRCNCSRKDRPWRQFAPGGSQERIERLVQRPLNIPLAKSIIAGEVHPEEMR